MSILSATIYGNGKESNINNDNLDKRGDGSKQEKIKSKKQTPLVLGETTNQSRQKALDQTNTLAQKVQKSTHMNQTNQGQSQASIIRETLT